MAKTKNRTSGWGSSFRKREVRTEIYAILAIILVGTAILYAGSSLGFLSPTTSAATPVLFDKSSQINQASVLSCWSGSLFWVSIPFNTCNSQTTQAAVNPSGTNLATTMPIAFIWANGFTSGDGIINRNAAGALAILGSQQPSNTLSIFPPLSAGCLTGLMNIQSCIGYCVTNCGGGSSGTSGGGSTAPPSTNLPPSCQAPPAGLPGSFFCPPNSIPVSNYQLATSLNGAVKRLDVSSFPGLYGEPATIPYVQNFYYTTSTSNQTVTQAWLVQRYGIDIRLQIQGDIPVINVKCLNQGTVLYVAQLCSQMIGTALTTAFTAINQYDKASGYIDLDIGYPGIPSQTGEIDDFLGAWTAGSSCILSASSVANAPVINGAVSPPNGAAVSVPVCIPHNAIPFAQGSCTAEPGVVDFTKYTNTTVTGTPLSGLCKTVKLRIAISSFGPTYKAKVFNANGGDSQAQTCYQIVSANPIAGTQQGCDWGIAYDQAMILDIPIIFDYMSYFTTTTGLKISCGTSCGPSVCPTGSTVDSTGKVCTSPNGYQACASGYNGLPPSCKPNGGSGAGIGGPNGTSTGSTLTVIVDDQFGIPLSGETVTLTTASGTSNGPNPCTTGPGGQCSVPFSILAGAWTVSSAENGISVPLLLFTVNVPPFHNVATQQINVQPGSNTVTLYMPVNGAAFATIIGIIIGIPLVFLLVYVVIRAARGGASRTTAGRTYGAAKKVTQAARKAYLKTGRKK